jgi:hypothetical protein
MKTLIKVYLSSTLIISACSYPVFANEKEKANIDTRISLGFTDIETVVFLSEMQ